MAHPCRGARGGGRPPGCTLHTTPLPCCCSCAPCARVCVAGRSMAPGTIKLKTMCSWTHTIPARRCCAPCNGPLTPRTCLSFAPAIHARLARLPGRHVRHARVARAGAPRPKLGSGWCSSLPPLPPCHDTSPPSRARARAHVPHARCAPASACRGSCARNPPRKNAASLNM